MLWTENLKCFVEQISQTNEGAVKFSASHRVRLSGLKKRKSFRMFYV